MNATRGWLPAVGKVCAAVVCGWTLLPAVSTASAQGEAPAAQSESLPAAKDLFERHIEVAGGWEAFRKHKNRVSHGFLTTTSQAGGSRLLLTIWAAAPDKMRSELEEPGVAKTIRGFDGKIAWTIGPRGQFIVYEGEERADLRETAFFNGEADYEKLYKSIETVGKVALGDRQVYHVRAFTQNDKEAAVYFDADTGLLAAKATTMTNGPSKDVIRALFQDYKDVEGVMIPMRIVQAINRVEYRVQYTRIDVNVDESKMPDFSPPAELMKEYEAAKKPGG
ncbi:MAG: hypothetical protein KIS87_10810 [Phycisphaeraceae bacterium]|nr:hypothetical protein [Phycisphaeraceae bacterium]